MTRIKESIIAPNAKHRFLSKHNEKVKKRIKESILDWQGMYTLILVMCSALSCMLTLGS